MPMAGGGHEPLISQITILVGAPSEIASQLPSFIGGVAGNGGQDIQRVLVWSVVGKQRVTRGGLGPKIHRTVWSFEVPYAPVVVRRSGQSDRYARAKIHFLKAFCGIASSHKWSGSDSIWKPSEQGPCGINNC